MIDKILLGEFLKTVHAYIVAATAVTVSY